MPDPFRQGGSNRKASLTIFMNRRLSSVPSSDLSLSRSPLNPPKSMHPWLAATSDSMMVLTMSLMADSASETLFPFPKRKCSAGERLESHRLDNRQATFFCPKMSMSKRTETRGERCIAAKYAVYGWTLTNGWLENQVPWSCLQVK